MFCGCCKLSNYHSYATHIDIFYPICFTWQKVRVVGNISAALGFLKPTAPWSSLRISCAAWHAAARLAARGRLLCSSVGPTRPPSPLSFSFVAVPMLKKILLYDNEGRRLHGGAASPTSPHKLSPPPFISPLVSSVFLASLFHWSRQRGVWRWKAAAAQPHPQGIPQSLLPLSTPCLRCSPRRCSWPTSKTACLQRDGATRWCRIPLSSLSPLIYFTPLCNNSYPPTGHRFPLDPLLAMETGVAL